MSVKVAVFVAGSWGTALSQVLADNGNEVVVWTRNEAQALEINERHSNEKYLPEVCLHEGIRATTSMEEAMKGAAACVIVAPSAAMRQVAAQMKPFWTDDMIAIHATKGFETETLERMSQVIEEELLCGEDRIAVLSGPSHAEEVVRQCPTTVVIASTSIQTAERAQDLFMNESYFRVYTNTDVLGVELAGALKNIIALGAGLSDGLGFGDNAKAALLTRGLAEIARLGVEMGANTVTFAGLAGVGDLVVTCTSTHSRNWRAGSMIGQGMPIPEVLDRMGMVVEGIRTTKAAFKLSDQYNVQLPITEQLHHVLFEGLDPKTAVESLMGRVRKNEIEDVAKSNWT
ncbi:NAD(P)H-dependent glycerol-3-phosphate dehydrogenase [Paenibacillus sp. ACRRX]|uniref:NAD(P)H-dependent glycerol-3-phosphate dehydrogenase n=1 Tax=unclassified Paenibacillus TaxID=185978 RepID=UPI001EF5B77A|nr:NAD(P)H-dependent glycerol-3-phosphate dehydrogenase [Paenibacillus sp. UMB4589-SE434]MCG7406430.1 NAD(P)H-dependent glycerol-3-phosphate dehydrogenase [Paenibacillus sp. ACRRX]MDK8179462.1 NAD(P)H-dependent glycerol-3-phosphate dehydrogenase [Paenibacillus sp. UMB4589-SE434]